MPDAVGAHTYRAMLVTDLDGTLLDGQQRLPPANRRSLEDAGADGVLRVVATGRSLFAARRAIDAGFPIDFLVYSSGAGTVHWPSMTPFHGEDMHPRDLEMAATVLVEARLDFMIQDRVPDTHRFRYLRVSNGPNRDFDRRIERYAEFADPLTMDELALVPCSHLVAIEPLDSPNRHGSVRQSLAPLHVVRTTSPMDHESRWIEVYPRGVGKSYAAERLRAAFGIPLAAVASVGNDYNDEDLLAWATQAYVVANAAEDLRRRYSMVPSNADSGVSEVLHRLYERF